MQEGQSENSASLTVGSRELPYALRRMPVANLRYYEDNPRIYSLIAEKSLKGDQAGIERELWNLSSTHKLFQDVKANGGLLEEVIVSENRVLEGNRRLCVYRKLVELAGSEEEGQRWSSIPARVITSPITQDDIFLLLGTLHIKGKAEWSPFEQAGFLYRNRHESHKSDDQLCALINLARHNVLSMLKAYELMLENGVNNQEKFSYFLEYTKNPKFAPLRAKDPELEQTVVRMIKEDRIPRAEAVRRLPEILGDKKAKRSFVDRKSEFDDALNVANVRNPEQVDVFYRTLHQARERLRDAPIIQIVEDIKKDHNKRSKIHYFLKQVDQFRKAIRWDEEKAKSTFGADEDS
jgi:hypothetical protein